MKFPTHILLDFKNTSANSSSNYWVYNFFFSYKNVSIDFGSFANSNFFFKKKDSLFNNYLIDDQVSNTLAYNYSLRDIYLKDLNKDQLNSIFKIKVKVKHKNLKITNKQLQAFYYLNASSSNFDENKIFYFLKTFSYSPSSKLHKSNFLWNYFNIIFLRKERIYTKLKYSRVPQYDIVSGGAAALFSGFLGFLISEKFGFELIDSGDFYILFMYVVFLSFFIRIFFKLISNSPSSWHFLSYKWMLNFYKNLFIFFYKFLKRFFR